MKTRTIERERELAGVNGLIEISLLGHDVLVRAKYIYIYTYTRREVVCTYHPRGHSHRCVRGFMRVTHDAVCVCSILAITADPDTRGSCPAISSLGTRASRRLHVTLESITVLRITIVIAARVWNSQIAL